MKTYSNEPMNPVKKVGLKSVGSDKGPDYAVMAKQEKYTADFIGLTKREYFAAMVMQGLISGATDTRYYDIAEQAVYQADKLIEALNK